MAGQLAFLIAFLGAFPLGFLCRDKPKAQIAFAFLIGFLPFVGATKIDLNLDFDMWYRGTTRAFGITLVEVFAIALLMATPNIRVRVPWWPAILFYVSICAFSMVGSAVPYYAFIATLKLLRGVLVLFVVARAFGVPSLGPWVMRGLGAGVIYSALVCIKLRYINHYFQVAGAFPHQNSLGMAVELTVPMVFATILAGSKDKFNLATIAAGALCIVFTLSRGSMAMFAAVMGGVYILELFKGVTKRKIRIALLGFAGALVVGIKAADTIIERFLHAPKASGTTRDRYEVIAMNMLEDHPFGVGFNHYSWVSDFGGYAHYAAHLGGEKDGTVHHIYKLTLAELGYIGLVGYLLFMFGPMLWAMLLAWKARRDIRGDIALGAACSIAIFMVHGVLEWAARQIELTYIQMTLFGIIAGIYHQYTQREEYRRWSSIPPEGSRYTTLPPRTNRLQKSTTRST